MDGILINYDIHDAVIKEFDFPQFVIKLSGVKPIESFQPIFDDFMPDSITICALRYRQAGR